LSNWVMHLWQLWDQEQEGFFSVGKEVGDVGVLG